jgi:hypothetical protein
MQNHLKEPGSRVPGVIEEVVLEDPELPEEREAAIE